MQPSSYRAPDTTFVADTCAGLAAAAGHGELAMHALARGSYPGRRLPAGVLPGVRSVGRWDSRHPQTWGLGWHRNEGLELTLLTSGRLAFSTDEEDFTLRPGHLTITRPWQRHRVGDPHVGAGRLHWVILDVGVRRPDEAWRWPGWLLADAAKLDRLTTVLRHNEHPVWRADPDTAAAFERIAHAVDGERTDRVAVHLNELVLGLADLLERRGPALDGSLTTTERAVEVFLRRVAQEPERPWSLDGMAAECGLGRTRFAHHCKRLTNLTPAAYLTRCRVERAGALLEGGGATVTEVAHACGFASSQYFATVFRRHTGHSPREHSGALAP